MDMTGTKISENSSLEERCAELLVEVIPSVMQTMRHQIRGIVKAEVTVPQFRVLARLSQSPANNGDLAEWIGVSLPAMSRMVDLLFKRGLVERNIPNADRRQVNISLTAKGTKYHQQAKAVARKVFAKKLGVIPDQKKELLIEAFKILNILFIDPEDSNEENNISPNRAGSPDHVNGLRARNFVRR